MRLGSLFSGIGGLELGLTRALGCTVVYQVEQDPFCRSILKRHFPGVPLFNDVRTFEGLPADIVCGGFPCQDLSNAHTASGANRPGLKGRKSGLWFEMHRIITITRPSWVVVENIAAWHRWVPVVGTDLEGLGYDVEIFKVAAENVGAPHARPRVFAIAHTHGQGKLIGAFNEEVARQCASTEACGQWRSSPPGGYRVDDGVSHGMDRTRVLGNSVVPQVAEAIGRMIAKVITSNPPYYADVEGDQ